MGDDLEVLSEIPDGTITVDLLTGKDHHSIVCELNLHVSKEITVWLIHQSGKEGINWAKMETASLVVTVDTEKIKTNKKQVVMFNFECKATLCTSEACYEAALIENVKWHTRIAMWNKKSEA